MYFISVNGLFSRTQFNGHVRGEVGEGEELDLMQTCVNMCRNEGIQQKMGFLQCHVSILNHDDIGCATEGHGAKDIQN